nr:monofunctional riboflavin biosynthesis protein RIBA 3, chloroplastic [Tanacetum cinerariifolium]
MSFGLTNAPTVFIDLMNRKCSTFDWGEEQKLAIQTLKDTLCNAPVLTLLGGPEDFVVYRDASSLRLGCVLMQRGNIGGSENASVFDVFGTNAGEKDNSKAFKTVDAEITPKIVDFFVSDTDGDPDCPTDGFSSVEDALATLRLGKFVIVVDDENGDIEGNIVFASSFVIPQTIGFLMRHGLGIISVGMTSEYIERLNLPLMSPENEHNSAAPSFTVTVDAIDTSTGVSSSNRAKTILALASPTSGPGSFRRPGHVFPLKNSNGGVLRRAGHIEAYVDLVKLASLDPIFVFRLLLIQRMVRLRH